MFLKFDKDGNGTIMADELTEMFVSMEKEKQERKKRRRLEKQRRRTERAAAAQAAEEEEEEAAKREMLAAEAQGAASVQGKGKGLGREDDRGTLPPPVKAQSGGSAGLGYSAASAAKSKQAGDGAESDKESIKEAGDAAQHGKLAWRVEPIASVLYGGYYESCYPGAKGYSVFIAFKVCSL
jgi:hypothetical protein